MINLVAGIALMAWCHLTFFRDDFWRADQRLPVAEPLPRWPSVAVIVPARNEAATIRACVAALVAQSYAGRMTITVVDDASDDGTADLARQAAAIDSRHPLTVLTAPPLRAGWTGKLAALDAGVTKVVNQESAPDYLWFTDADVVHAPGTLSRLVSKAETDSRDLVSLMVRLHCESPWEHLLIPAFVFFFQMLFPFPAVNDRRSPTAAAAGGCVLIRRDRFLTAGGLAAIKGEIIDDCALARIVKASGGRPWLGLADESRSLRAAASLGPLWAMVERTAFAQLGHSTLLLALTVVALAAVFLGPAAVVITWPWHLHMLAGVAGLATLGLMVRCTWPTFREYGRSPWECLLLPIAAALYGAMTMASGVAHWRHRGGHWKGRHYGPSSGPGNLSESL